MPYRLFTKSQVSTHISHLYFSHLRCRLGLPLQLAVASASTVLDEAEEAADGEEDDEADGDFVALAGPGEVAPDRHHLDRPVEDLLPSHGHCLYCDKRGLSVLQGRVEVDRGL